MSLRSVRNPVNCIIVISIFVSSLFKLLRMTTKVLTVEGGGKGLKCGVSPTVRLLKPYPPVKGTASRKFDLCKRIAGSLNYGNWTINFISTNVRIY